MISRFQPAEGDGETTMADDGAVLDQVNIISSDLRRSLDFYRRLGAPFPRPLENPAGELFHASSESEAGAQLELDSLNFAQVWNTGWARRTDLAGRIVLAFVSLREKRWTSALTD